MTRSSHGSVEEIRTAEISRVGSFQMRQRPHLGSPEKVGQRLWVKVATLPNTHLSTRTFTNSHLNVQGIYLPGPGKGREAVSKT